MVLRQPLAQRRWHQKRLLTITCNEVLGHHGIVFAAPDGAGGLCDSLPGKQARVRHRRGRSHIVRSDSLRGALGDARIRSESGSGVPLGDRQRQRGRRCGAHPLPRPRRAGRTDIADHALEAPRGSTVKEVLVLARCGLAQTALTGAELREFGNLEGVAVELVDVRLDPESFRWLEEDGTFSAALPSSRPWRSGAKGAGDRRRRALPWPRGVAPSGQARLARRSCCPRRSTARLPHVLERHPDPRPLGADGPGPMAGFLTTSLKPLPRGRFFGRVTLPTPQPLARGRFFALASVSPANFGTSQSIVGGGSITGGTPIGPGPATTGPAGGGSPPGPVLGAGSSGGGSVAGGRSPQIQRRVVPL